MKGAGLLRLAWFLAALLLLSTVIFSLSTPDTSERPVATSYEPGGVAAFAELLRRAGYQVEISESIPLYPKSDQIPIAFLDKVTANLPPPEKLTDPETGKQSEVDIPAAQQYLRSRVQAGHGAILLAYDNGVKLNAKTTTTSATVRDVSGRNYKLISTDAATAQPPQLADATAVFAPATQVVSTPRDAPAYDLEFVNGGSSVYIGSGEMAMNAYIDRADNARFLLDAIRTVAPPGSRLLILDATVSGGGEPSVLDLLGPWSKGALLQMFLVFVIIVYSLGKRFGLSDEMRAHQAGTRDLLEGIANTYTRARAGKAALAQIMDAQDRRTRRFLKLPVDSPKRKRNDLLPSSLVNAFRAAEHLEVQDPTPDQALHAVRGLESEVNALLGPPRSVKASRHRVKSR